MNYRFWVLLMFSSLFLITSCKTKEKLVYFQNKSQADSAVVQLFYTPTLKVDDFLSIQITAEEPETAIPFNLPVANQSANSGYAQGNPAPYGYLIDENGNVELPILGTVHIGGLRRSEAGKLIQEKLKNYLPQSSVHIQILNYKITVLGDVGSPGTYKIPNERITLLEAIGLAGDLNITGERNNILVVREENGARKQYRVDLTTDEIFTSPVYYLHQNDVVYVEPNVTSRASSTLWRTTGSLFISVTSLIITTVVLIVR